MGHKHADKYKQLAKDAEMSDHPWEFWEFKSQHGIGWIQCGYGHSFFDEKYEYRRKPETVALVVNGREFCLPKWETKSLEEGQEYYVMTGIMESGYDRFIWQNDIVDKNLLRNKLIYLSEEHVIEWVKLWKFMTGGGE